MERSIRGADQHAIVKISGVSVYVDYDIMKFESYDQIEEKKSPVITKNLNV